MQNAFSARATSSGASTPAAGNRWLQLIIAIVCMILIANLQYGWTLFVQPLNTAHHWSIADIQVAFSIFVALETWLTPLQGWIVDRLGPNTGPKLMIAFGGILVAVAWIINSIADSLGMLYFGAVLSGTGAGAVYATCVGNAVKWFPDRRGLAVGLTAAGFGAGAALSVIPIRAVIAADGYQAAFFWFGLVQGAIIFVLAWLMRGPLAGEAPAAASVKVVQTTQSYTPRAMLATPVFWIMYIMFLLVAASGLMATAQVALIARDFHIANNVLLFGGTALTVALLVDNVCNGLARPLFGWISDNIGREKTMALAFGLGGISYWLLGALGTTPWLFVIFAGLIFLTWGEIYSLFPSTCTDSFGSRYATANLSFLYTAKGVAAFLEPLANVLKAATGSWQTVFVVTAIMNFVTVALALFVLRPLRVRQTASPAEAGHFAGAH
ncbi:MAG: oxalate/formate MFS antiporter [Alphaproteobacteria bacterium]|nr:oxalate/formate MFS antiporter [Alphaproteobacteria bacterium]